MRRTVLLLGFVGIFLLAGCTAPQGVLEGAKAESQYVAALMDQYAEVVQAAHHPDGPEATMLFRIGLMRAAEENFNKYRELNTRVVEWMEGSPFNPTEAEKFATLALELYKHLDKDKEGD
jgi:hypothetical protein